MDSRLRERVNRERRAHFDDDVLARNERLKRLFKHTTCSPTMRRLEQALARAVGVVNGKVVLDVGCGWGQQSLSLLDVGATVCGIDVSEKNIARVQAEAARRGYATYRYEFHVMDAHALEYGDKSFDLIVGRGILHHLDWPIALTEFRRVLKSGGRAVFLEPLAASPLLALFRYLTPNARTGDEKPLTAHDLRVIEGQWIAENSYYGIVSAPIAAITSMVCRPFTDNILLRAADSIERRVNHVRILRPYNQYVLLNLTPR